MVQIMSSVAIAIEMASAQDNLSEPTAIYRVAQKSKPLS